MENANLEFKKASDLVKKKLNEVDALINGANQTKADEVVIVNKTKPEVIMPQSTVNNNTEAKPSNKTTSAPSE